MIALRRHAWADFVTDITSIEVNTVSVGVQALPTEVCSAAVAEKCVRM